MGYELKIYIGDKCNFEVGMEKHIGIIEKSMFELGKIGDDRLMKLFHEESKKKDKQLAYLFASNGDTKIKKDRYNDVLFHMNPKEVLKAMVESNKEEEYRVYSLVIPYLRKAITTYKKNDLSCILYGH